MSTQGGTMSFVECIYLGPSSHIHHILTHKPKIIIKDNFSDKNLTSLEKANKSD